MGKRGPKPGDGVNTAQVSVKMPDTMKQHLAQVVNNRKAADPSLPLSYGLSEYIREVLAAHIASLPDKPAAKSEVTEAKPRRAPTRRRPK